MCKVCNCGDPDISESLNYIYLVGGWPNAVVERSALAVIVVALP